MNPLQALNDIAVPESVNAWPLAWGWWALAALVLLIMATSWILIAKHIREHGPRKQAIKLLQAQHNQGTLTLVKANEILKRLAISYSGRNAVSAMFGDAWVTFLQDNLKASKRKESWLEDLLFFSTYPYQQVSEIDEKAVYEVTLQWLRAVDIKRLKHNQPEVSRV